MYHPCVQLYTAPQDKYILHTCIYIYIIYIYIYIYIYTPSWRLFGLFVSLKSDVFNFLVSFVAVLIAVVQVVRQKDNEAVPP